MKLLILTSFFFISSHLSANNLNKAIHFFFEAEYSLINNQMIIAGKNYEKATIYSKSPYILESAADFFFSIGNYNKSIKFYLKLNSLFPSDYAYVKGLYNSFMAIGKYSDAERLLESSRKFNLERLTFLFADFYYSIEDWDNLLDSYTDILIKYPEEKSILREMLLVTGFSDNTKKLISSLDRLWKSNNDTFILKALIRLSYDLREFKQTLNYFNYFSDYNKERDFVIIKARSLLELGEVDISLKVILSYRGELDENIFSLLVDVYDLLNDDTNHFIYCEKLLIQYPDLDLGYRKMISYYIKTRENLKALNVVNKAKRKFKSNPIFSYLEAQIYYYNNKYKMALRSYLDVKKRGFENLEISIKIGYCYEGLGELSKSDSVFSRLINNNPQDASLLNNYAFTISERENQNILKLKYALSLSRKANNMEPENAAFLDTLGWIYYKLKYYNNSLKILKKSIKYDKSNPVIW